MVRYTFCRTIIVIFIIVSNIFLYIFYIGTKVVASEICWSKKKEKKKSNERIFFLVIKLTILKIDASIQYPFICCEKILSFDDDVLVLLQLWWHDCILFYPTRRVILRLLHVRDIIQLCVIFCFTFLLLRERCVFRYEIYICWVLFYYRIWLFFGRSEWKLSTL